MLRKVFLGFFTINLLLITYIVDVEQLIIADTSHFVDPLWPPRVLVDVIHWWGRTFDPLLMARPVWWQATIWLDAIFFGPFYAAAIYALIKRKNWIRTPALVWAGMMFANVSIIMLEEIKGLYASPNLGIVMLANASWFLMPVLMVCWMRKDPF